MAKGNRFPSDANKKKEPANVEVMPERKVEGVARKLVQVEYRLKNHHMLNQVHAVGPGINHVDSAVWEAAKKHPATMHLIKEGHLIDLSGAQETVSEEPQAKEPEDFEAEENDEE